MSFPYLTVLAGLPLIGSVLLVAGLSWHLVVSSRQPGPGSTSTADEPAVSPKLSPPAVGQ